MENFKFQEGQFIESKLGTFFVVIRSRDNVICAIPLNNSKEIWGLNPSSMIVGTETISKVYNNPLFGQITFTSSKVLWDRDKDFVDHLTLKELSELVGKTIVVRNSTLGQKYYKDGNVLVCNARNYLVLNGIGVSRTGIQSFNSELSTNTKHPDYKIYKVFVGVKFSDGIDSAYTGYAAKEVVLIYESIEEVEKEYNVKIID